MTPLIKPQSRGVTLIELTVVISMIISLISALFVSANYYRESSHRSACISQIAQIQKAVRSYQNFNNLAVGDAIAESDFVGVDKPINDGIVCPMTGGSYTLLGEVPPASVAYAKCREYDSVSGTIDSSQAHTSQDMAGW